MTCVTFLGFVHVSFLPIVGEFIGTQLEVDSKEAVSLLGVKKASGFCKVRTGQSAFGVLGRVT